MINPKRFEQLAHDIKRVSKIIPIIRDEEDKQKRDLIAGLLIDEMDRLMEDLNEAKGSNGNGGKKWTNQQEKNLSRF